MSWPAALEDHETAHAILSPASVSSTASAAAHQPNCGGTHCEGLSDCWGLHWGGLLASGLSEHLQAMTHALVLRWRGPRRPTSARRSR